jgi:hypothetical protein
MSAEGEFGRLMERLAEAMQQTSDNFMALARSIDRQQIESHPDLAYLDAQMDGFYGAS